MISGEKNSNLYYSPVFILQGIQHLMTPFPHLRDEVGFVDLLHHPSDHSLFVFHPLFSVKFMSVVPIFIHVHRPAGIYTPLPSPSITSKSSIDALQYVLWNAYLHLFSVKDRLSFNAGHHSCHTWLLLIGMKVDNWECLHTPLTPGCHGDNLYLSQQLTICLGSIHSIARDYTIPWQPLKYLTLFSLAQKGSLSLEAIHWASPLCSNRPPCTYSSSRLRWNCQCLHY